MKQYTTPKGKTLSPFYDPSGAIRIKFTTGGELPEELTSSFTTEREADKAIQIYLASKSK